MVLQIDESYPAIPSLLLPEFKTDLDYLRDYARYDERLWKDYALIVEYTGLARSHKEALQDRVFTDTLYWVIGDFFRVASTLSDLTPGRLTKDLAEVCRDGTFEFALWVTSVYRFIRKGDEAFLDGADPHRAKGVAIFQKAQLKVKELEVV